MMRFFFTAVLVTVLSFNGFSQKYELGKVTVEELKEKQHSLDTSAVAAVLFKKGVTYFNYSQGSGFEKITEVQCKVKIYKKEGYDWANHEVRYYLDGNSKENLFFKDVVTYNLVDGKIVKSKLKSDGEFDEKMNKYWGKKKITLPNVKEGSIIEFSYVLKSPNYGDLADWDFQYDIPVNYSEYKTIVPEYFNYNENQKGFVYPERNVVKKQGSITLSNRERSTRSGGNRGGGTGVVSDVVVEDIKYWETETLYHVKNVPALNDERFVNNIKNYTSSISHELATVKFPNEMTQTYSTDWESVVRNIYKNDDFGGELAKIGYFEDDVKQLISGLTTNGEKTAAIFNFVKSKIKWNGYYGYSCNEGVRSAYKNNTGNAAEINLMLTSMLRFAGIGANPVLISTRSNGIAYFPSRNAFNYVISAVEIENGLILLDATDKYSLPNVLPMRDLNWFGRIIRKEGSSAMVELMPKNISKEMTNGILSIDGEGNLSGKIRVQYFDYSAHSFRNEYGDLTKESYLEKLEKNNNGIEVNEYESLNVNDLSKPVVENYSFSSSNSVEKIGDKLYFNPMFFFAWTKNPFIQEKREYPVDFGYPNQDRYMISVAIPEGYVVESIPEPKSVSLPDSLGTFKFNVTKTDKQIQLSVIRDFNAAIVPAGYYESLKQFFDLIVKSETEKVVLKKA
ncbi:DUF3857 domain-containing protein [Flavobacterium sp.]|uniref:DUF3857 domain-containing protein n=1 Tax=Flavobacterium sp. TaxID=239 RepID=UPI0028BD1B1A|nr:DUF3857 domain-containing protein [Flavobacterium sp.]